jgi:hypothetical protein
MLIKEPSVRANGAKVVDHLNDRNSMIMQRVIHNRRDQWVDVVDVRDIWPKSLYMLGYSSLGLPPGYPGDHLLDLLEQTEVAKLLIMTTVQEDLVLFPKVFRLLEGNLILSAELLIEVMDD